jgi:hypothetical protein
MEVPLKPDKHMFYKPTWVKETQSASAMMTRSHGICKDGRYCVRLWVPIALRVMSTAVSTCKCKDHIQAQHRKHTMWLPRKEGICHRSRRENTVNDHRRDIHLRVHVIRSKRMRLPNTLEDHRSEPHNWASAQTHKATVIREFSRHHTKKCTTSTRHAQCTHHRSCRDPACSCRQLPCFPLPPAARVIVLFLFPKPTLLGFYAPKGSRIYFGFEIGVPCFLRVMKNYDFKCECTWNYLWKDFFSKECLK